VTWLRDGNELTMAWRLLAYGRSRSIVALVGVAVAALLMLTVLSLKEAVFRSALLVPGSLRGDLIVLSQRTLTVMRPARFPVRFLHRLRGVEGVARVSAISVDTGRWTDPWTHREHQIRVWGIDLQSDVLGLPGVDPADPVLRSSDTVLFDELSRPKFGPVAAELRSGKAVATEVNGRDIEVVGLTRAGISVGIDGNLFTTPANFQRLFPSSSTAACHIGSVALAPGADLASVLATAQRLLGSEALILRRVEMVDSEIDYMRANEPVDFIMTMIAAVAFTVGLIIVYQILFADVLSNLPQFATLKAMGFANGYLLRIVMSEGLVLSLLGFWPGLAGAHVLAWAAQAVIVMPVDVTWDRALLVLGLTVAMCCLAATAAVRKLSSADPANVF